MVSEKHMFTLNQVSEKSAQEQVNANSPNENQKHPTELSPSQTPKSISHNTQTHRKPGFTSSGTHGNT